MQFLQSFQKNMIDKMAETKNSIEATNKIIDGCLDNIDQE